MVVKFALVKVIVLPVNMDIFYIHHFVINATRIVNQQVMVVNAKLVMKGIIIILLDALNVVKIAKLAQVHLV